MFTRVPIRINTLVVRRRKLVEFCLSQARARDKNEFTGGKCVAKLGTSFPAIYGITSYIGSESIVIIATKQVAKGSWSRRKRYF